MPFKTRPKTIKVCSNKGENTRSEIPAGIRSDLEVVGGVQGLCNRLPPEETIIRFCDIHHALSEPFRVKILHLLDIQPLCVCIIRACLGISDSKLSYHLAMLKKAGLIEGKQQGNWIIYSLSEQGNSYMGKRGNRETYPAYYTRAD